MNQEIKTKWVAALRSGKYRQGKGLLRQEPAEGGDDQFCCLGVLCDVLIHEGLYHPVIMIDEAGVTNYDGEGGILTEKAAEIAGLSRGNPRVRIPDHDGTIGLAYLNDYGNRDFNEIADLIDAQL